MVVLYITPNNMESHSIPVLNIGAWDDETLAGIVIEAGFICGGDLSQNSW